MCDKQGEVASAPHLCRGHHTPACEALRDSRTQHRALRLRQGGHGRWGPGEACRASKKDQPVIPQHSRSGPRPSAAVCPAAHSCQQDRGSRGGCSPLCGCLKVPLGRSPQGQVPLLLKVWSWPYRQPQRQHTFFCFPARKWKPAASPAHAAGSVLLPGASASSQASQTPSMFSLHRNRHNTEPARVDGRQCPAVQGSSELEADKGPDTADWSVPSASPVLGLEDGSRVCNDRTVF